MSGLAIEPFAYDYMVNAMWVSALVGGVCAFLSAYLMLKGWSLIGDASPRSARTRNCWDWKTESTATWSICRPRWRK